jgi:hypothetical protein
VVLRELYPVREASWRVPTLLLFSGCGMAAGAWMGGALYDAFGYYGPAFMAAIAANLVNLLIVSILRLRQYDDTSGVTAGGPRMQGAPLARL